MLLELAPAAALVASNGRSPRTAAQPSAAGLGGLRGERVAAQREGVRVLPRDRVPSLDRMKNYRRASDAGVCRQILAHIETPPSNLAVGNRPKTLNLIMWLTSIKEPKLQKCIQRLPAPRTSLQRAQRRRTGRT